MGELLRRLWKEDQAAVQSTELVLILGILVFGIVPGLVAMRNSVIVALGTIANLISLLTPQVTISQVSTSPTQYQIILGLNVTTETVIGVDATFTAPIVVDPGLSP